MLRLVVVAVSLVVLSPIAGAEPPATSPPSATSPPPPSPSPSPSPPTSEPEPEPVRGQRFLGIGGEIGFGTGIGAALHLGARQFGLYVAAGIMPILVFGNEQGSKALTFDAYRAIELNTDVYIMPIRPSPRTDLGLSAGYSGNTILGSGFNVGIAARHDLRPKLALTIFGGLEFFPDARDHLAAHGYPTDRDASLPHLQGGLNLGLVVYP